MPFPNSPTAASLGKYGEYPVNLQNGLAEITVPLCEIKSGSITVPVNLSYHSSGIRVNDRSSWVGLSWSLNAGGVVTSSVRGAPDVDGRWFNYRGSIPDETDIDLTVEADFHFVRDVYSGNIDTQPDIYYYNFNGYSGSFYFGNEGQSIYDAVAYTSDLNNLKIERGVANDYFIVTTPDGTTYRFGQNLAGEDAKEYTSSEPLNNAYAYGGSQNVKSAWYLTEIISADKSDTVLFKYGHQELVSETISDSQSESIVHSQFSGNSWSRVEPNGATVHFINSLYISEIHTPNSRMEFNIAEDRLDHPKTRLVSIDLYKKAVDGDTKIKSYLMNNDHYYDRDITSAIGQDGAIGVSSKKSLMLKGVAIIDEAGDEVYKYAFEYDSRQLPPVKTTAQDYWGYYNGRLSNSSLIPASTFNMDGRTWSLGGADRNADADAMKAGILNKIIYPTGGYTRFYYESNRYSEGSSTIIGGGLRIAKIENYVYDNPSPVVTKTYSYGGGVSLDRTPIEEQHKKQFTIYEPENNEMHFHDVYTISSRSYKYFEPNTSALVEYSTVTEFFGSATANAGKNVYSYTSSQEYIGFTGSQYHPFDYVIFPNHFRGLLQRLDVYKNEGGAYSRLRSDTYTYEVLPNSQKQIKCLKVLHKNLYGTLHPDQPWWPDTYIVKNYYLQFARKRLRNKTSYIYVQAGDFSTYTSYQYDGLYGQKVSEQTTDSQGNIRRLEYVYPYNAGSLDGLDTEHLNGLTKLVENWIIEQPVQTDIHKDGVLIESNRLNYKVDESGFPLLDNITRSSLGSEYEIISDILSYDPKRNVIAAIDRGGVVQSMIWGYNKNFPVAKITNGLYVEDIPDLTFDYSIESRNIDEPGILGNTSGTLLSDLRVGRGHVASIDLTTLILTSDPQSQASVTFKIVNQQTNAIYGEAIINSGNLSGVDATFTLTPGIYRLDYVKEADIEFSGVFQYERETVTEHYDRVNEILYDSFEEHSTAVRISTAKSGVRVFKGAYKVLLKDKLQGSYLLSYWKSTNGVDWTFEEVNINVDANSEYYTIGDTDIYIDEVRLHPHDAEMITHTYDPLIGITSETDKNGQTLYYEYDALGRLKWVMDNAGRIVSKNEYNYYK